MSRTRRSAGPLSAAHRTLAQRRGRSRSDRTITRGPTVRYVLKQKLLSWGDDYYIRDDQGREVYLVDGKAISLRNQLSFKDLAGNELAFIRQKLLKLSPTYEIHRDGKVAAVVQKKLFALFHHRFSVD